jgi:hypothetical protein
MTQCSHARRGLAALPSVLAMTISLASQHAQAEEFQFGEIQGRANGKLSLGALWSAEDANKALIYPQNAQAAGQSFAPQGVGRNNDDRRLNYRDSGTLISTPLSFLGEMDLRWQNYGFFTRGKAWYDYRLNHDQVAWGSGANGYQANNTLDDSGYDDLAKFQGAELLDAYVYGDFELADRPLQLRAGNQSVNWGESLFFLNGINSINPVDIASLRRPGSEIKEALVPVPMLYGNLGLTDNLSMETFYQLQWRQTALEGCGTYFAAVDYVSDGCGVLMAPNGPALAPIDDATRFENGAYLRRASDDTPRDSGQFGLNARYFIDALGTEVAAYYMNIHSRTPYASAIKAKRLAGPSFSPVDISNNAEYQLVYAEDINIYGLSFNSNLAGWSVFGEASYRPNQPLQIFSGDLLASYGGPLAGNNNLFLNEEFLATPAGGQKKGYDRYNVGAGSLGVLKSFSNVAGADSLNVVAEVASRWVNGLADVDEQRYGRTEMYGQTLTNGTCTTAANPQAAKHGCTNKGFITSSAWGVRTRSQLNYANALAGVNLAPYLALGYDVDGWSWDNSIIEHRVQGAVGVRADYLSKYSAELSYNASGGSPYHLTGDTDFVSLSASMGF